MKKHHLFFIFILLTIASTANGQRAYYDSIASEVDFMTNDSIRLISLFDLTKEYDGEPELVIEYGKKAIQLANSFADIDKYVRVNYFVGKAYNETRQPEIALDYFEKAQERIQDTIAAQPILRNIFKQSGLAKLQLSNYKSARQDFQKAIVIFEQIRDRKNIAFLEHNIGNTYLGEGDFDLAVVFFKKAGRSFDKLRMTSNVIEAMAKTGMTYIEAKNSNLALNEFNKAIARAERAKDEKALGIAKRYMAYFYDEKEFYDEALRWQEAALEHFITAKDTLEQGKMLSELGLTLMELNELEKGFDKEIEALQLFALLKNDKYVAISKNNLAKHYIKIIGKNEAVKHLEEAIEINKNLNNTLDVSENYLNLGYVFYQNREYKRVINYANASLNQALKLKHLESMKRAALLLSRTYQETGQLKQALSSRMLFDSLYQIQNDIQLKKLTSQIEGSYNKIQKQEIAVENGNLFKTLFWSLAGIMILVGGIFFFLPNRWFYYSNLNSNKKNNPKLTEEPIIPPKPIEKIVETPIEVAALPLPEVITKTIEMPMNWSKPLELVTSIISLQSLTQQDDLSVIEYQMEQARLKAVQIIQQKIAKNPAIEQFDYHDYAEEMISNLNNIHRNQTTIIDYQVKSNETTNIFQTIILGLITTELVSNAILHGFGESLKGVIKVELEKRANNWMFTVSNNGKDSTDTISKKQGLSLKIVHLLSKELGGKLEMDRKKDWTEFRIGFKNFNT